MTAQTYHDCGRGGSQDDQSATRETSSPCSRGDLKTLVRPNFFCGQTLEAGDLTTLVDWSRDRFGLQRFKTGWGVVCGLQVEVRPGTRDQVVVRPGYAVGLCGADIVVPCNAFRSLADPCRETNEGCVELRNIGPTYDNSSHIDPDACSSIDTSDLIAIDIFLRSNNAPFQPRPSLARHSCTEATDCSDARVRETYGIVAQRQPLEAGGNGSEIAEGEDEDEDVTVAALPEPLTKECRKWLWGYLQCFQHLLDEQDVLRELGGASEKLVRELAGRIGSWPEVQRPRAAAFVRDSVKVEDWNRVPENPQLFFTNLLVYLLQDCRSRYFAGLCPTPESFCGVPLARAWMRREQGNKCVIVYIDSVPPHRREIAPPGPPAPCGGIGLGPYIGMPTEHLCGIRRESGLQITLEKQAFNPKTPKQLVDFFLDPNEVQNGRPTPQALLEKLAATCDDELRAHYITTPFGDRIIAFKELPGG